MRPPQPSPPSGEAGHDEEHREVQQKISEVLPGHAAHRGTQWARAAAKQPGASETFFEKKGLSPPHKEDKRSSHSDNHKMIKPYMATKRLLYARSAKTPEDGVGIPRSFARLCRLSLQPPSTFKKIQPDRAERRHLSIGLQ